MALAEPVGRKTDQSPAGEHTMKTIVSGRFALLAVAIPLTLAASVRARQAADPRAGGGNVTAYGFADDQPSWVYGVKINGASVPVTAFPNIDAAACGGLPPRTTSCRRSAACRCSSWDFTTRTWPPRESSRSN